MFFEKFKGKFFHIFNKKYKGENYISDVNISKELIRTYLPKSPTIVDCGAHIGVDSLELADIPGSSVFAFEALPELYRRLVQNTQTRTNIHCYNVALSNYNGEANFYVSSGDSDGSSSLLAPKNHLHDHPNVLFDKVEKVRCLTLDTWASNNNISKIDMLWLDMQGFEQQMLAASTIILKSVSVIHSEVSTRETYEGVHTYDEYRTFLEKEGFQAIVEAIPAGYDMGNVLFVRKELK